jgi:integrase
MGWGRCAPLFNPDAQFQGSQLMAVILQDYRKNKPWIVTWKNPWTGKKKVLKFDSENEANSFENATRELFRQEKAKLRGTRIKNDNYPKIIVKELIERYILLAHASPVTIRQTGYHASHIISLLGQRQVSRITSHDILGFSELERTRGIAQSTVNRRVSILRAAINWGVKNSLVMENPLRDLRMPRAKSRRISPPSPPEAKDILKAAAPHVQRVIVLGLCSGVRIGPSELFGLTWRDVDLKNAMIRMPNARKNNQFGDYRDVPIRRSLLPIMKRWLSQDQRQGHEYVITWNGKPVRSIGQAWHTALRKAGIGRRIRPYDLRHAYATYSLAGGADIGSVAGIMGHTDASMILKTYQHVQDAQKRAAVEALPDILELRKSKEMNIAPPGLDKRYKRDIG